MVRSLDVEFLAGRPFRQNEMRIELPTEENPVVKAAAILNESAARRFGWTPEEAVGKIIRQPMSRGDRRTRRRLDHDLAAGEPYRNFQTRVGIALRIASESEIARRGELLQYKNSAEAS